MAGVWVESVNSPVRVAAESPAHDYPRGVNAAARRIAAAFWNRVGGGGSHGRDG